MSQQKTQAFIWRGPQDDPALRAASAEAENSRVLLVIVRKFFNADPNQQDAHQ